MTDYIMLLRRRFGVTDMWTHFLMRHEKFLFQSYCYSDRSAVEGSQKAVRVNQGEL
jgi:hypothetical protein